MRLQLLTKDSFIEKFDDEDNETYWTYGYDGEENPFQIRVVVKKAGIAHPHYHCSLFSTKSKTLYIVVRGKTFESSLKAVLAAFVSIVEDDEKENMR